jgi:AAA15 family ATPase/GTPase
MSEHFIKNIEIENFKCFENFKAEGFGRVNLIGGKNNVGKTAFMEAVFLNIHSKNVNNLFSAIYAIKFTRENLEFICEKCSLNSYIKLFENTKHYFSKSNINEIKYTLINKNGEKKYSLKINSEETTINSNNFSYQFDFISNIIYIDNFGFTNLTLKEVYMAVQRKDKEDELYKYINDFDNLIEKFKIIGGESPECKLKGKDEYLYINEFGDGLKHYISIICSLYACENGYLFIDEIDNGIHYTNLDKLWEIILTISKKQNVQVFATTHSKECIESYARVAKKLEDNNSYYFEMIKNIKNENIYMRKLDSNQLDYEINHNGEFRG